MFPLTFVIPTAPYHEAMVERAIASCLAQTVPCHVVVVYDYERMGPSWARNRGLERVDTPFVAFLDSDDWVDETFAEEYLRFYDSFHYIYGDWWQENIRVVQAPDTVFKNRDNHIITTLIPTAWARHVGGFDETLPGDEDLDFYLKLVTNGLCGKRLPMALFHYGKDGKRARGYIYGDTNTYGGGTDFAPTQQLLLRRYGDKPMGACCNDNVTSADFGMGAPMPGDVLARWLVDGQRQRVGGVTGRVYRKIGNSLTMYMAPADIDLAPNLFARVVEMPPPVDDEAIQRWRQQAAQMLGGREPSRPAMNLTIGEQISLSDGGAEIVPAPNVERVLRLYQQNVAQSGNAV